jgi:hypothetical protein
MTWTRARKIRAGLVGAFVAFGWIPIGPDGIPLGVVASAGALLVFVGSILIWGL